MTENEENAQNECAICHRLNSSYKELTTIVNYINALTKIQNAANKKQARSKDKSITGIFNRNKARGYKQIEFGIEIGEVKKQCANIKKLYEKHLLYHVDKYGIISETNSL